MYATWGGVDVRVFNTILSNSNYMQEEKSVPGSLFIQMDFSLLDHDLCFALLYWVAFSLDKESFKQPKVNASSK